MAAALGIGYATLRRRFDEHDRDSSQQCLAGCVACSLIEAEQLGADFGKAKIKDKLWKKGVENGSTAELIFLAKNRIGYSDRQEVKHSGVVTVNHAIAAAASLGVEELDNRMRLLQQQPKQLPVTIEAEIVKVNFSANAQQTPVKSKTIKKRKR